MTTDDAAGSARDVPPDQASTPSKLTVEEAGHLERFSKGRAKIEHDLALLEGRPPIDAFSNFNAEINERNIESVRQVWATLDDEVAQCATWTEERDRIEEQTVQFDSADMENLRRLAKGMPAQISLHDRLRLSSIFMACLFTSRSCFGEEHVARGY